MPLIKSGSEPAFKQNVAEMITAGHPRDQALAAAYATKRKYRAGGGFLPYSTPMMRAENRSMMHTGPIKSIVPGRTDAHNMNVPGGAYVVPAHAVSHLGQNNTDAGHAILHHMFSTGPYGASMPSMGRRGKGFASGGAKDGNVGQPVPIAAAGGEHVISPEAIIAKFGDLETGHKILDKWVVRLKKAHEHTLRKLPGPAKD